MTTFNTAIRNRIDTEMRTKQFTPADFYDLADKFGMQHKSATNTLKKLEGYGLLKIVKKTKNATGGEPTKTYQVINGAELKIKSGRQRVKEHRAKVADEERQIATAFKNLSAVMNGWVVA